jgi:hypoxanthine phosphoribosyltransferase
MEHNATKRVTLHDKTFELMIPHEELDRHIAVIAQRINQDYAGKPAPIVLGVLNGSFMFMGDLMKKIEFNCEVQFVKIASYEGTDSTGSVKELIGLNGSIEGRDIIIVEDIVDTGGSIAHLMELLEQKKVGSVAVATMFFKPESYSKSYEIKYPAMNIGNEFIVGYGLDYDQLGRNLKDIFVIVNE